MAEAMGVEPMRHVNDLPHFECGPFSHLGTPPYQLEPCRKVIIAD